MDYAALNEELTTDPMSLGYAPHVESGADNELASLLNVTGEETIALASVDNATFVRAFIPHLFAIAALQDEAKKTVYGQVWQAILALPSISFADENVSGLMTQAISDGIITVEQLQAITQRSASRAEVLFGAGVIVSHGDIAKALRG